MAAVYPTQPPVTAQTLWLDICSVARTGASEAGLLQRDHGAWSLKAKVDDALSIMAQVFLPLLADPPEGRPLVVAHLAQSLDGRIARSDGESHWITGEADLDHTHRLRAICDAVLVGAQTVLLDDCQLTVRRCSGTHPLRIVVDSSGRVPIERCIFTDGAACTLWVVGEEAKVPESDGSVELVRLPCTDGHIAPRDVLAVLHARGIRRLFVEGGGVTVSHFLQAGCLDRLHLAVAPLLIGEGRSTLSTPLGDQLADCPRPRIRVFPMGDDWLFDCAFDMDIG
jgi:diaminohydroxyphosphoribosylaminopyrimidine deaminase/5-amino-6-(5-phosphoribosylamino)uracil reductase